MGPLTYGEHLFVLVVHFRRWTEVDVVRTTTSKTIIHCLNAQFAEHGLLKGLRTDNDSNLVSREIEEYLEEMGIEHRYTTPLWSRANGEVERQKRMNREASFQRGTMCAIIEVKFFCIEKILFLLLASMWSEKNGSLAVQGCGSVVSNTLISPGYPNDYPSNMDCSYEVPIADGKELKIDFRDFDVGYLLSCEDDYVKITSDKGQPFGVFCRHRTEKAVLVTGTSAVIKFHSDFFLERRGFQLFFTLVPTECGTVVNSSLRSPGYPKKNPRNMHCSYSVNIPRDMEMKIDFKDFEMEDGPSCFCDYSKITNENNENFGAYCGMKTGRSVSIIGDLAVITFHSDFSIERRGFLVFLTFIPVALPKITSPAPVVRSLLYFRLTCSATGSHPIYTAIIRKSATLINTTNTATITLYEEGNYTCVATNRHGTDVRNFLVIFNGKTFWTENKSF
ncbi:hypothetical protein ACROYT_G020192 [Oculina patagonica]